MSSGSATVVISIIGANLSEISALAADLVGGDASVAVFEPHPELAKQSTIFCARKSVIW